MALIETEQLTKLFYRGTETIRALDNVSLKIETGEFLSIIGPSGSGKSTLMYILGLLDRQTGGSYHLDGKLTDDLSDDERAQLRNQEIGFVFQTFHLLPRANAIRNVAMPLVYAASYDHTFSDAKILSLAQEALERVGLKDRMKHRPNELSGGQRQRVAIARAIVNRPQILFADEPTGNLDSRSGQEILALFEELNQAGVTVIMVTHDPLIAHRARRMVSIFDGAISKDAPVISGDTVPLG
jgi:putative ABC transport system ATP-binding protein